jgi:hypothetical protein
MASLLAPCGNEAALVVARDLGAKVESSNRVTFGEQLSMIQASSFGSMIAGASGTPI